MMKKEEKEELQVPLFKHLRIYKDIELESFWER